MPLYTYRCRDCNEQFDLLVGVTLEGAELKCAKCGGENLEKRVPGSFSVGKQNSKPSCYQPGCSSGMCPKL